MERGIGGGACKYFYFSPRWWNGALWKERILFARALHVCVYPHTYVIKFRLRQLCVHIRAFSSSFGERRWKIRRIIVSVCRENSRQGSSIIVHSHFELIRDIHEAVFRVSSWVRSRWTLTMQLSSIAILPRVSSSFFARVFSRENKQSSALRFARWSSDRL